MKKFIFHNSDYPDAINQAVADLRSGKHRNDVLENSIRKFELDESIDSVGYGGFPNIYGKMELDAAFMDGNTRALGCVAGVKHFLPVQIARKLMEEGLHTMLAGEGAEIFAKECGFTEETTLSDAQKQKWELEVKPLLADKSTSLMQKVRALALPKKEYDTVVMLASDGNGISAATSTSGWPYKYPSRIGDSPIAGAGFYVDSNYGGCVCNYTGEISMRTSLARFVVAQMENGKPDIFQEPIKNLAELNNGLLRGISIYSVGIAGNCKAVAINIDLPEIKYWFWNEDMKEPECRIAEKITIPHWN